MSDKGHIELDRSIDAITVGVRHRKDLGDIDALAASIEKRGLLQPITITPDGTLVCGARRLEAVRRLGWRTLKVWVRTGLSDRLSHLLAQQDENCLRKPLSLLEAEALYREVKQVFQEEATRRQEATRFGGEGGGGNIGEENGPGESAAPWTGESRVQASHLITGTNSYQRLERVGFIKSTADDESLPDLVRDLARDELNTINAGGPVDPGYRKVKAAIELAQPAPPAPITVEQLAEFSNAALARVRQSKARAGVRALAKKPDAGPHFRSLRSFLLTWADLAGWTRHYDAAQLAQSITDSDWDQFNSTVEETIAFRDKLAAVRASGDAAAG